MGRRLCEMLSEAGDLELAAIVEREGHPDIGSQFHGLVLGAEIGSAVASADCLLDFSLPEGLEKRIEACVEAGKAFVSGITGLSDAQQEALGRAAERIAVVWAPNMSRGVHVLGRLVSLAAGLLADYHAEIFEIHHAGKADSPSGTAWSLAEKIAEGRGGAETVYGRQAKRRPGEIGICAARGGDVVGEHQVMFLAAGEQLILTHRATSRDHFCSGALDAVRFAARASAGRYTMKDVFGG